MKTDGFPQYVTVDYLAKGLSSIREGAERKLVRAQFQNDRFAEAHAQGVLDGAQGIAKGVEKYFESGIGVAESPYVQAIAVAAIVEGICLGMVGFALWGLEAERVAGKAELELLRASQRDTAGLASELVEHARAMAKFIHDRCSCSMPESVRQAVRSLRREGWDFPEERA